MASEVTLVIYDPEARDDDYWWNKLLDLIEDLGGELIESSVEDV